jgi:tetratricopeptide (TPR) repeat protein
VDRARAVAPHFVLDAKSCTPVSHICRRLDGIPLAIELAAARVRTLTPDEIAAHLDQQFRLLTGTRPGTLRRQQTLRASLDWSWDLLDASERAALSRLSVFAGVFALEAAEAVLTADPIEHWRVLDLLARLSDWGLVGVETGTDGERYRLLETVRQYAAERLAENRQEDATHRRHREFFLALAEQAMGRLQGAETAGWVARLQDAHDDVRAAISWNLGDAGDPLIGLRLTGALWRFWWLSGSLTEGRRHLQNALAADSLQMPTKERAIAVNAGGALAFLQGDYATARVHHQESLRICELMDDTRGIAGALGNLGNLAFRQGDLETAEALFLQAQPIFATLGEARSVAHTLNCLASIADARGEIPLAQARSQQALTAVREVGEGSLSITILSSLCDNAYFPDDPTAARAYGIEALEMARQTGVRGQEIFPLVALAQLNCDREDWSAAREFLREALRIVSDLDLAQEAAYVLEGAATVVWQDKLYDQAVRLWAAAAAQREEIGSPHAFRKRAAWEDLLVRARTEIGSDRFGAAWQQGRSTPWRKALEDAAVIL